MTIKKLWVPTLIASMVTLLIALLVLPLQAGAQTRATTVRYATIAPAAFSPSSDTVGYHNVGGELVVATPSTSGSFMAPLFFEDSRVRITNMVLYALDNGPGTVCLSMYRITPENGGTMEDKMGGICSTDASSDIRSFDVASWTYPYVYGAHGPYLWVTIDGTYTDGYSFYGAKVTYTFTP